MNTRATHEALASKLAPNTIAAATHRKGMRLGDPLIQMMEAVHAYALAHEQRFESKLAEDYVLGPEWLAAAKGARGLLNGCGNFDGGTLESLFWSAMEVAGYSEADL